MKAFVLAAGKGSRISADIEAVPKSTLCINGKPIIRSTVETLITLGLEVVVCVGYRRQKIFEALIDCPVTYFYNPFYGVTNNIASLWMAQRAMEEAFMVVSADLVFPLAVPKRLLENGQGIAFAADVSRVAQGDYFFHLGADGTIDEYGPAVPPARRYCENLGMMLVCEPCRKPFIERMNAFVDDGRFDHYYEEVSLSFIHSPVDDVALHTVDMSGLPWQEIDYIEDYKQALARFAKQREN